MLFKKLFRLLVVSGTLMGGASGCAANAADAKKPAPDAGAPAPDAGAKADPGAGASGW